MMASTALRAESKKEENIIFISDAHEKFYYEKLKEVRYQDVYHKALVYCLGISDDTRRNIYSIYDFKTGWVKTECCLLYTSGGGDHFPKRLRGQPGAVRGGRQAVHPGTGLHRGRSGGKTGFGAGGAIFQDPPGAVDPVCGQGAVRVPGEGAAGDIKDQRGTGPGGDLPGKRAGEKDASGLLERRRNRGSGGRAFQKTW